VSKKGISTRCPGIIFSSRLYIPIAFIIIFSFNFQTRLFAQGNFRDGFIITCEGDTLHGQVNLASNAVNCRKCEFRAGPETQVKTYSPGEIAAYRINDEKFFITKEIVIDSLPRKVFLEYLVDGIVDLYSYKTFDTEYFFIEKEGKLYSLENEEKEISRQTISNQNAKSLKNYQVNVRRYVGVLTYLFSDAEGLSPEIQRTGYGYKSLIRLTLRYHKMVCNEYECIKYSHPTRIKVSFEPGIALAVEKMILKGDPGTVNNTSYCPGAGLRFQPARGQKHWSVFAGLRYSSSSFSGIFFYDNFPSYKTYDTVSMKYNMLHLPLVFEYRFGAKKLQPFLSVGLDNIWLYNLSHSMSSHYKYGYPSFEHIMHLDQNSYAFRTCQIGLMAGAGLTYKLNDKLYLTGKLEYERRSPVLQLGDYYDYFIVHSLMGSLTLGINLN
jgi:hypothetical protein